MICPHCIVAYFPKPERQAIGTDAEGYWNLVADICPNCKKLILWLEGQQWASREAKTKTIGLGFSLESYELLNSTVRLVKPQGAKKPPCPPQVPDEIRKDYEKAALVLADSPEASAALSRRCLQHMLNDKGFKVKNLAEQIDLVLKNGKLPTPIAENIDAIRNIGNFAAHPQKSLVAAEILPVEPEEAEWNLDVLESLFDHFYVQPEIAKQKRDALNQKLKRAGKPPMR